MKCPRCRGFIYTQVDLTKDRGVSVLTDEIHCVNCGYIKVQPHKTSKKNKMQRDIDPKSTRYNHRG
jgi:uncharacterized Zn finger protein